ncbi:hypothetical protein [Nitrosomonas sp. wSCUT-2]
MVAEGCGLKPVTLSFGLVYAYSIDRSDARAIAKKLAAADQTVCDA